MRLWGAWGLAVPVLALGALLTTPSPAQTAPQLPVDLLQISSSGQYATAPLIGSSELVQLTIDPNLQRTASKLLARASPVAGAIILAWPAMRRLLDKRFGKPIIIGLAIANYVVWITIALTRM